MANRDISSSTDSDSLYLWGKPSKRKRGGRETSFVPGHLSNPIYDTEVDFLLEDLNFRFECERHKKIATFLKRHNCTTSLTKVSQDPIGCIQSWASTCPKSPGKKLETVLDSLDVYLYQKMDFLTPSHAPKEEILKQILDNCSLIKTELRKLIPRLEDDYDRMKKVENVKDSMCFKELLLGDFFLYNGVQIERDLTMMWCKCHGRTLTPTSLFLCALDKMQSRFPLRMYWGICDVTHKYAGLSILDRGDELISLWEPLRRVLGQDFYALIAGWEPMTIGSIVARDDDNGCTQLWDHQWRENTTILERHHCSFDLISVLPRNNTIVETTMSIELLGISKIFGYPTLDIDELLTPLQDYGVRPGDDIDPVTVKRVDSVMRRDFCMNYRQRKGHYPKIRSAPGVIVRLFRSNRNPTPDILREYDKWGSIVFEKNFEFDYCPDQTELLKDSATAVNRSAWGSMYDRCAFKKLHGKGPPDIKEKTQPTRTLDAFLKEEETDKLRRLMTDLEEGRPNTENHCAVQCGKECELKVLVGRAFTKQTYEQRLIQTGLEHNVASTIFPFVPDQTMTDGEITGMKRSLAQIDAMNEKSEFLCLDLKKWCLFQRHKSNVLCGKFYDELFGLRGIYEFSHYYFIDNWIFTNNRHRPPNYNAFGDPIPGKNFINQYRGGFEGLHQKKWTHVAVASIKYAAEMSGVNITQMGQGDNQVIVIHYTEEQQRNRGEVFKRFYNTMEATFLQMGHKLKAQETWHSKHLHEYSKIRSYKGVSCSRGTQKASKLIPDINDGLFSIPSMMSTINTMTESISKADTLADRGFMLNCILQSNILFRKEVVSRKEDVTPVLLWPTDFGGLPISSLLCHNVRGNDDKITLWLSIIATVSKYNPAVANRLKRIWQLGPRSPASDHKERARLFEDIYSLNIVSLPSAESDIRGHVRDYLKSDSVRNPIVRDLYEGEYTQSKEDLIEILDTMTPQFIQLSSELVRNSNAGILDQLQKRFTGSKTVEKIARKMARKSFIDMVQEKNDLLVEKVNLRLRKISKDPLFDKIEQFECPVPQANLLRRESWGIDLVELTKPPYQHQVLIKTPDECTDQELRNCITIRVSSKAQSSPHLINLESGPMKPYVGGSTHEKIRKPTLEMTEKTSFAKAALDLGKIKSWAILIGAVHLVTVIDSLLLEKSTVVKTPEGVSLCDLSATVKSGNIFHRFVSALEHSYGVINYMPGAATHFHQSSNSVSTRTQGGIDISVFFQYVYVSNMAQLINIAHLAGKLQPVYLAVFQCEHCTHVLPKPEFDVAPGFVVPYVGPKAKPTEIIAKTDEHCIQGLMEHVTGMDLARAIDLARTRDHSRGGGAGTGRPAETSISVNDFRQLDFKRVIASMIVYSHHCRELVQHSHTVLSSDADDNSFVPLAELVIESQGREGLIALLGAVPGEHTMLTVASRVSAYISRSLMTFCRRNWQDIISNALSFHFPSDCSDSRYGDAVAFCAWLHHTSGEKLPNRLRDAMNHRLRHGGYVGPTLRALRVKRYIARIPRDNVTMVWRSRCLPSSPPVYRIPLETRPSAPSGFPRTQLECYGINREFVRSGLQLPHLGYMARVVGVVSSAASKYIEIIQTVNIYIGSVENIYSLAEGSGGTLTTLLYLYPNAIGHYNTLLGDGTDLRDDATDVLPPAAVATGMSERIHQGCRLPRGVTNIKEKQFHEKLTIDMIIHPPDIVTIDPESEEETSNLEFLEELIETILVGDPKLLICKLFYYSEGLDNKVDELRAIDPSRYFVVFKPFTSNPVGREVFLISWRKSLGGENKEEALRRRWDSEKTRIVSRGWMSLPDMKKYIEISRVLTKWFLSLIPNESFHIHHRYQDGVERGDFCNLRCGKFLDLLMEAIDCIHSNKTGLAVHLMIRRSGTEDALVRYLRALMYVLTRYLYSDLSTSILMLERYSLNPTILRLRLREDRADAIEIHDQNSCAFFSTWGDAKFFIRDEAFSSDCSCPVPTRYMTQGMLNSSLSLRFIKTHMETFWGNAAARITRKVLTKRRVIPEGSLLRASNDYYGQLEKDFLKTNRK